MIKSRGLLVYALEFESRVGIEGIEVGTEESGATDSILPLEKVGGETFGIQGMERELGWEEEGEVRVMAGTGEGGMEN